MGSFAIPSLSALRLWRRGSKTQGGEPGAPGRRLNTVARAAAPAMARSGQGTHGSHWWRAQFGSPARIREWAAQELTNGRLLPWFAVAYGAGVILYFTAEREPALWAAVVRPRPARLAQRSFAGRSCPNAAQFLFDIMPSTAGKSALCHRRHWRAQSIEINFARLHDLSNQ